ncbi:DUF4190 domain-containing protein [Leifsonia sp. C5G2]|uniref:DUF4190 domain-containing protein n=1 Tax=Leifsonia sp. C5G2 TaxID=2735269 RepID=UPI00158513C9|nr:DUF4190 domain-containing protein [Leifsonia sp. C5G2]NUU04830.1 DUF4190 domain-containing protein [Leifsonia sp. C5G2]
MTAPDSAPQPQPAYQAYPAGAPAGAPTGTNPLAIVTLIAAFLVPIAAIICGHIALGQIRRTGQNGHGLALTGLILGYVFTAFWLLFIVLGLIGLAIGASMPDSSYS